MQMPERNVVLNGITWSHTRGFLPVVATAQRFCETRIGLSIDWKKRSLQQFADAPLHALTDRFDLLVIDHPSIGEAARNGLLLRLDEHIDAKFLDDQQINSVGASHQSYFYEGHQYALAIDAATPVAGWRPDLLDRFNEKVPATWKEVLALAHKGLVAIPAIPIDSLMNLFMLSNAVGAEPFRSDGECLEPGAGAQSLQLLRELVSLSAPGSLERNPIRTWQLLAESDNVAYCPFAYGYSNYSRRGYAANLIQAGQLVSFAGKPLRSTLGGAGLAISAHCHHLAEALSYVQETASIDIQSTLYTYSGGQPGHRKAWLSSDLNQLTNNFFRNTLSTLDSAWLRPRFPGFIEFQDQAAGFVHEYLIHGGSARQVVDQINNIDSLKKGAIR